MINTKRPTIVFTAIFLVFLILYLIIINPFASDSAYEPNKTPDYDPNAGEGVYMNTATMYDQILQNDFEYITVKNEEGIFRLDYFNYNNLSEEGKMSELGVWLALHNKQVWVLSLYTGTYAEYLADGSTRDPKWNTHMYSNYVELDGQKLASIRVATGIAYYQSKITIEKSDAELETEMAKYGLSAEQSLKDDACWFEVKGKAQDGKEVHKRVYIGDYSDTLGNHYARVGETNRVYVLTGDYASYFKRGEYYAASTIKHNVSDTNNYYYLDDFSVYHGITAQPLDNTSVKATEKDLVCVYMYGVTGKGFEITESDGVQKVTCGGEEVDLAGKMTMMLLDLSDPKLPSDLKNAIIGKGIDDKIFKFSVTYSADSSEKAYISKNFDWTDIQLLYQVGYGNAAASFQQESYVSRSVNYICSIGRIITPGASSDDIKVSWVNSESRDPVNQYSTYEFGGGAADGGFTANTDRLFNIVYTLQNLTAAEVYSLTLDDKHIDELGLDAHAVYYKIPLAAEIRKGSEVRNVEVYKYYETLYLVSDPKTDEDGTVFRYVASFYDGRIYKINEADGFAFVSDGFVSYIEKYMFHTALKFLGSFTFDFNYADAKEDFSFGYNHDFLDDNKNSYTTKVTETFSGKEVDTHDHGRLYTFLGFMTYDGSASEELTQAEIDAIADGKSYILKASFKLNGVGGSEFSGTEYTYYFYTYSTEENPERRVLVTSGESGAPVFYTSASAVEKIYRDCNRLINGERVEPNDRY